MLQPVAALSHAQCEKTGKKTVQIGQFSKTSFLMKTTNLSKPAVFQQSFFFIMCHAPTPNKPKFSLNWLSTKT